MNSVFSYNNAIFNAVTFNNVISFKISMFIFLLQPFILFNLPPNTVPTLCFYSTIQNFPVNFIRFFYRNFFYMKQ